MKKKSELLPQVPFSILLALSLRPRHGYEIMQQVEEDSAGKIKLGAGALYGGIKQLCELGLITEMAGVSASERRRYYKLTAEGRRRLGVQLGYLEQTVRLANERKVTVHEIRRVQWI